jgi:hypothetical protein
MKIRFEVDQAEAFRRGIDCPKSIVTIEVDPAKLEPATRSLLADALVGIDVVRRYFYDGEVIKGHPMKELLATHVDPERIVAAAPTFNDLMAAVEKEACVIQSIQASFQRPVQLRLLKAPPVNESEFHPVKWKHDDFADDVRPWLEQGFRVKFEGFIHDVQKSLNELLNAKNYQVGVLPIPGQEAQGRFYCDRFFSATFMQKRVVGHSPTIVYNEKTGRVADATNLFHALDIYLLDGVTPGKNINDLNILRWEGEKWVIIAPEGLMRLANQVGEKPA